MKLSKRLFCILLALLMLTSTGILTAAAESAAPACPTIYVHGFMGSDILEDRNDPNSKVIWPPDMNDMTEDIKAQIPSLVGALLTDNWETFGTIAIDLVKPYFEPTYLADDGTCPNTSGVYFRYPSPNAIPKNGTVLFRYDWRLDPLVTAEELNDFIEYVCSSTGAEKVNIICHSLGGIVFLTYLSKHGDSRIKGACLNTTAIYGESYTGDLMRGDIVFDGDSIDYYMRYVLQGTEYDTLLTELISALNEAHILDLLAKKANGLTASQKERVVREVLLPMFGNWLTIWAMIPDKDTEAAQEMVFETLCADQDRSVLRGKIDEYNNDVRKNKVQTLQTLNDDANVYVISRYGYSSIPVTSSFRTLSDGTVDTKYTSFGATTSDYDKTLTKDQIKNVPAEYISPDQRVDASTCLFPEQTWFVRNMKHSLQAKSLEVMMNQLLAQDEQATVNTFSQYPRFLVYDAATDTLSPDVKQAESASSVTSNVSSFFDKLKRIFEQLKLLFSKLPDLLSKIKK